MVLRFLSDFSRPFNGGGKDFGDDDDDDDEVTSLKSGTQTATLQLCTSAPKTSATPQRSKVAKPSTQASLIFFK